LHEFLPRLHSEDKIALSATEMEANEEFAKSMDMTIEELQFAIQRLQEVWLSLQQHNLYEINLDNYSFIVLFCMYLR
jgi:hypothetical protein